MTSTKAQIAQLHGISKRKLMLEIAKRDKCLYEQILNKKILWPNEVAQIKALNIPEMVSLDDASAIFNVSKKKIQQALRKGNKAKFVELAQLKALGF